MPTIDISEAAFGPLIEKEGIVLVDFWAAWCGPCRSFAPIFEAASEANPEITFAKVDTEAERQLAGAAAITSIPTLMIFRDGVLLYREPGALPANALADIIEQVKAIDMVAIEREIAEAESKK